MSVISTVISKPKIQAAAIATAKVVAITLSFAVLYVMMTTYSPVLAKSSLVGMFFGKTLRFANMLRAFALVTPLAAIGTHLGALSMDLSNPAEIMAPHGYINTAMGIGVFYLAQKWGRSRVKDLTLLAIFGLLSGLVVTLSKAGLAAILGGDIFMVLVKELIWFKMLSSMLIYMAGYALVQGYEVIRNARSSSK